MQNQCNDVIGVLGDTYIIVTMYVSYYYDLTSSVRGIVILADRALEAPVWSVFLRPVERSILVSSKTCGLVHVLKCRVNGPEKNLKVGGVREYVIVSA